MSKPPGLRWRWRSRARTGPLLTPVTRRAVVRLSPEVRRRRLGGAQRRGLPAGGRRGSGDAGSGRAHATPPRFLEVRGYVTAGPRQIQTPAQVARAARNQCGSHRSVGCSRGRSAPCQATSSMLRDRLGHGVAATDRAVAVDRDGRVPGGAGLTVGATTHRVKLHQRVDGLEEPQLVRQVARALLLVGVHPKVDIGR